MCSNEAAATARSMSSWDLVEHGPAFIKVQWPASSQQQQDPEKHQWSPSLSSAHGGLSAIQQYPTRRDLRCSCCANHFSSGAAAWTEDKRITFRWILLYKCQEVFEHGEIAKEKADKTEQDRETQIDPKERVLKCPNSRRCMLGKICFYRGAPQ
ncbi:unnamed protein product [Sphagnum balticum]